jgi:uncharacterized repeat protein (TIGR03803 family)
MKKCVIKSFLPGLVAVLCSMLAGQLQAQTFSTLYTFTGGTDGGRPIYAGLLLSSNRLYGTAGNGGDSGLGTVFAVNVDGTGFTTLYSFSGASDGANPHAGLTISGNTLYGTTLNGGANSNGTVFAVNTDGTGFQTLHSFTATTTGQQAFGTNSDGVSPASGLFLSGNTLYGTALYGGSSGNGTVFKVNADGTGFATLHSFSAVSASGNGDGAYPVGGLIMSGNTLYGTASAGGVGGYGGGTVFELNTDGTGFRTLHSFSATTCGGCPNSGGNVPYCALLLLGNALYGTASGGGSGGSGVVFGVNTDGTGFTVLHSFPAVDTHGGNSGGAIPKCESGLILLGNTLYGSTSGGGNSSSGTVFALGTNGASFSVLYKFSATSSGINDDGSGPFSGLVSSANVLYGAASYGGNSANGTIFSISLPATPPELSITQAGPNIILSWPTTATGFTLQSTTNLGSSAIWTTNLPAPIVINGQNTVTNPISGAQQFFQLSQ